MFTVAAVLPFLPLIEDAMIRQLGHDDFAKRETATRFLERMLRDTDGISNYYLFLSIKEAQESSDPEIRIRSRRLCDRNAKYDTDLNSPWFCIVFKIETAAKAWASVGWQRDKDGEIIRGIEKTMAKIIHSCSSQAYHVAHGHYYGYPFMAFKRDLFTIKQIIKLKNNKDTLLIRPIPNLKEMHKEFEKIRPIPNLKEMHKEFEKKARLRLFSRGAG
jgi:hypothetical protein